VGGAEDPLAAPQPGETAVFLMGYENLPIIVKNLLENGWEEGTPAALVHWGTRAEQETVVGSLGDIEERVRSSGVGPPSVLVVGRVVALRETLRWRERLPLFGKRILITRALEQAHSFARKIMELGGEPICLPVISLVPPDDRSPLDRSLERLSEYDWVVFTSANGVNFFVQRLRELSIDIRELRGKIAAIGPATAAAVSRFGLQVAYQPNEYRAESLLEGLAGLIPPGSSVLLPRASEARDVLPDGLRSKGIRVDVVPAYKAVPASVGWQGAVEELLADGRIHVITFASSSAVRNFVSLFGEERAMHLVERSKVACIGPVTAETASSLGMRVDIVAREYTIDGLLESIMEGVGG
ncbi:MAG: uroporphyrinogen-III synthase, partial [Thermacetogeniaceae bacterium]